MDVFITGTIFALACLFTGYQWGKGVGRVEGQIEGRKAIRAYYEKLIEKSGMRVGH